MAAEGRGLGLTGTEAGTAGIHKSKTAVKSVSRAAAKSAAAAGRSDTKITPGGTVKSAKSPLPVDDDFETGNGGETHQIAGGTHPQMTNQKGQVVADDENSLKSNERGPVLLEDWQLIEKTQHFDHERIPERIVHARGYGAHGTFELTESLEGISKAGVLNRVGEQVPVFVRFSTVGGNMGSPDLARDVRGFAVKMYTPEGNWDIVGNNIPVFFIQDAIKFTDLIHSVKQEPDRGFPQAQSAHDTFWDFVSLMPESRPTC